MAENTQEELGKPAEAIEGKKWADIIRSKGFGSLHGVFSPKWQYELNGSMTNLVEANKGFQTAGHFGIRYASLLNQPILGKTYNTIYPQFSHDIRDPANFFITSNYLGDKVNRQILFGYYSWPDPRFDVNRGIAPLQFAFVLPLTEGEGFERAVVKNADLIEEIFQNVYPGLTGEQGMKRLIVNKVKYITGFNRNKAPFFSSKDMPFSHPVGENAWNFSKSY